MSDGMIVLGGYTGSEWGSTTDDVRSWAVLALDATGEELWKWGQGSDVVGKDINGAAIGEDGFSVFVGATGTDDTDTDSTEDLAAIKLDVDGNMEWIWQDGSTEGNDAAHAVAMAEDGSVVLAGVVSGEWAEESQGEADFAACMLEADMTLVWTWQNGTDKYDKFSAMVMLEDGSVVLAGQTFGNWAGTNNNDSSDFAAVKLDASGNELWRWQDGTGADDDLEGAAVGQDGGVVLAGSTFGNWDGISSGANDFAAVKLDSDGNMLWKWQGGTLADDVMWTAAMSDDDEAVLAGSTEGDWVGSSSGSTDAAVAKLAADGTPLWTKQIGGPATDVFEGMAAGPNGSVVLAGSTNEPADTGTDDDSTGDFDFWVVMLPGDTLATPAPTPAPATPAPEIPTPAPGLVSPSPAPGASSVAPAPATSVEATFVPAAATVEPTTTAVPVVVPVIATEGSASSDNTPVIVGAAISGAMLAATLVVAAVCLLKKRRGAAQQQKLEANVFPRPRSSFSRMNDVEGGRPAGSQGGPPQPPFPGAAASAEVRGGDPPPRQRAPAGEGAASASKAAAATSSGLVPPPRGGGGSGGGAADSMIVAPSSSSLDTNHQQRAIFGGIPAVAASSSAAAAAAVDTHSEVTTTTTSEKANDAAETDTKGTKTGSLLLAAAAAAAAAPGGSGLEATSSTADASTAEKDDSHCLPHPIDPEDDPGSAGTRIPSTDGARAPSAVMSIAQAVYYSASQLANHCQIPGVSEAATMVSILVTLVSDSRDSAGRSERDVKRCRSIVTMLERAMEVLGKDGQANGQVERILLEDVNDAIADLVQIVKTYKSKNKFSQVLMSSLFRQRQDEAEAVIDRAIARLHLGLQVRAGHKLNEVGNILEEVGRDVREGQDHQRRRSKEAIAGSVADSLAEARRLRRRRNLDQIEIPEDHLTLTDELLGRGGFGAVYMADYNGRNAAAKVVLVEHELGGLDDIGGDRDDDVTGGLQPRADAALKQRLEGQRKAFLRELEAMIRLRSPHTVNIYGAITSCKDRLVLVMELLAGGDLRAFLKSTEGLLPEARVRRIVGDICAGVAFLHGKATVHGDLKSANVLLDGVGRAKIADFGTSRWAQHTNSTGLATYGTKAAHNNQMTFAWAAPEVLDSKGTSCASDVYSFGVVAWEVLTTEVPWADVGLGRDIYLRVVVKGDRPEIPAGTPEDIAGVMRDCWAEAAAARPKAGEIMARMRSHGWNEDD
ncbi:unnamed protein product [Pylaiella littoralis]